MIMIIDLLILLPLIGFTVLGFRDGSARKLVAIGVCILGMFIGQYVMHDLGKILVDKLNYQPATAPVVAFLMVFLILFMLQFALYRIVTGNYKFGGGGIVDRIIGVPLGAIEGTIFISVMIMMLTMVDPPRDRTTRESRLYKPIAAVAPLVMDLFSNALPAAQQALDNVATPQADTTYTPESVRDMTSPQATQFDSTLQKARQ
jgi:uncharacterized membrane protein required for colicin V production